MAGIDLKRYIDAVPDFPKPGILFRDIQPLLACPEAFEACIVALCWELRKKKITKIGGLDARGFLFGVAVASRLSLPFFMVRKGGKLPGENRRVSYDLEYGTAEVEIGEEAVRAGDLVALIDDLLATGGTLNAAARLVREAGAEVALCLTVIELTGLGGRALLERNPGSRIVSLIQYKGK